MYCLDCAEPFNAEDAIPGQVGARHPAVAFDPDRRNAWKTQRGLMMLDLDLYPGALCREIWQRGGWNCGPNQICTRMGELAAQGLVERTGRERFTETDTPADEWTLTVAGKDMLHPPRPPWRFKKQ